MVQHRRRDVTWWVLIVTAVLALPAAAADPDTTDLRLLIGHDEREVVPADARTQAPLCEFCNLDVPPITLQRFTSRMATDVAARISDWNLALIARTDSLLRAGFFGPPAATEAAGEAARYFKYHALTSMDFISYLSTQRRVAWESDEKEIAPFYYQYANPGVYPVWGLRRVLLGGGAFCMDFDVAPGFDAERMLGTRAVHLRADELKVDGVTGRVWSMEMDIPNDGKAHYLFSERYKGRLRQFVIEDGGRPLKVTLLEDVEGFYVRKWGTHKCGGLVLWRTQLADGDRPGDGDCIGGAAYFPGLHLRLPGPLPDVDLDDLREFPGFQPLIAADRCNRADFPAWLAVGSDGAFRSWGSEGEIPRIVRDWFPDL